MDYKFINTEYLDSVSGGDPEIICELVNLFKEQSVEISGEMKSAFRCQKLQIAWIACPQSQIISFNNGNG